MSSKHQRKEQTATRAASIKFFKKKRLEASSFLNFIQLNTNNDKLNTIDTDNKKVEFGTWFWNKSANEIDLDF